LGHFLWKKSKKISYEADKLEGVAASNLLRLRPLQKGYKPLSIVLLIK